MKVEVHKMHAIIIAGKDLKGRHVGPVRMPLQQGETNKWIFPEIGSKGG
jgi:hypothetical protein